MLYMSRVGPCNFSMGRPLKPRQPKFKGSRINLILTHVNDVTDTEHRRHPRLQHRTKIKVTIPNTDKHFFSEMRDFSQSGLFLLWSEDLGLERGTVVQVQTTEFEDAPIQTAKVIRIEQGTGVALEFI